MEHQGLVRTAGEKTKHQVALIAIPASKGRNCIDRKTRDNYSHSNSDIV